MIKYDEHTVQKQILQWLHAQGFFVWHQKNMGTYIKKIDKYIKTNQKKGVPDILGILPDGKFLGIECKTQITKMKISPSQKWFHIEATKLNAVVCVTNNLPDVQKWFKELGYV